MASWFSKVPFRQTYSKGGRNFPALAKERWDLWQFFSAVVALRMGLHPCKDRSSKACTEEIRNKEDMDGIKLNSPPDTAEVTSRGIWWFFSTGKDKVSTMEQPNYRQVQSWINSTDGGYTNEFLGKFEFMQITKPRIFTLYICTFALILLTLVFDNDYENPFRTQQSETKFTDDFTNPAKLMSTPPFRCTFPFYVRDAKSISNSTDVPITATSEYFTKTLEKTSQRGNYKVGQIIHGHESPHSKAIILFHHGSYPNGSVVVRTSTARKSIHRRLGPICDTDGFNDVCRLVVGDGASHSHSSDTIADQQLTFHGLFGDEIFMGNIERRNYRSHDKEICAEP